MVGGGQASDRAREATPEEVNRELDGDARQRVEEFAGKTQAEMSQRIDELSGEWDVERTLETNASILALSGVLLGTAVSRKYLWISGVVFGFLLQHAVQGWCPPLPLFRKMGIRTRKEINREKYAMKALRGDFDEPREPRQGTQVWH